LAKKTGPLQSFSAGAIFIVNMKPSIPLTVSTDIAIIEETGTKE